ncbi:hypothetical protein DSM107010_73240 [Chroococcidiopsis cubana SAG 39.79]|uniref:Uncharacterized protein n=2 Tax=Chroococcidiopsis TaxID=54298 RepID=A0AB37U860_9CYAN|nr:hypothetical protein [Chroococcidiopsis cubana]RUS92250.1 hypothetical protein DSM107010_73240 [Chroococcidiopsis cubana SAG 39.79]
MPDSIRYALDKFESKLSEQVQKDVEARYASRLTEAKAKDALLPKGVNGRAQSPHQTSIEAEMIVEEHKLLANPSYKHKLAAEETRLVREYQRQQRAVNNPLVQVQK